MIAATWGLLVVVSALHRGDFLSRQTLLSVTFTMAIVGVLAVGQALVAMSGGILDLSVQTALILPAWVAVSLLARGVNILLVILAALAAGGAWGLLNALIIVFGKLNPVIVTLGTNFAGAAVLNILFQSAQTPISSGLAKWGSGTFLALPNIFWPMVAIVALAGYFVPRSRAGRHMVAVGGNPQAARTRGISLRKTRFSVFVASGILSGCAALLFAASNLNFVPNDGSTFLLPTLASVIVAGIALSGGVGNLWMILLSVGLLSTVPTSFAFFGFSDTWQMVPPGVILVIAVSIDGYRRARSRR
jgi:ribose transport system permease protein